MSYSYNQGRNWRGQTIEGQVQCSPVAEPGRVCLWAQSQNTDLPNIPSSPSSIRLRPDLPNPENPSQVKGFSFTKKKEGLLFYHIYFVQMSLFLSLSTHIPLVKYVIYRQSKKILLWAWCPTWPPSLCL